MLIKLSVYCIFTVSLLAQDDPVKKVLEDGKGLGSKEPVNRKIKSVLDGSSPYSRGSIKDIASWRRRIKLECKKNLITGNLSQKLYAADLISVFRFEGLDDLLIKNISIRPKYFATGGEPMGLDFENLPAASALLGGDSKTLVSLSKYLKDNKVNEIDEKLINYVIKHLKERISKN